MNYNERTESRKKMMEMPGWDIHWACVRFINCFKILFNNSKELIEFSTNPPVFTPTIFADIQTRIQKNSSDCEIIRLIHNYLASAKTLVDISRRNSKKYLQPNIKDSYDLIIKNTYSNDPCIRIIQNLRNYVLHVDTPTISNRLNVISGISSSLALLPEKLIAWDKWDSVAKSYLQSLIDNKETIVIDKFFSLYTAKAKTITELLLKEIIESNKDKLNDTYFLLDKILDSVRAENLVTDPLIFHFFSRNKQYNINGELEPIFADNTLVC